MLAPGRGSVIAVVTVVLWAPQARATLTLYNNNCVSCHSTATTTCDGCHAHGVHSSDAKTDINLTGRTDKVSYVAGSPVKVTVNAGDQTGWVRVVLLDQNLKELARKSCPGGTGGCTTSATPITLTTPAPATTGTYIWAVAWYGNDFDTNGASFGSGTSSSLKVGFFSADVNNPNHGYQTVALPAFTVSAASAGPAITLEPASLDFQTVVIGAPRKLTTQVHNAGNAALDLTSIGLCSGTPTTLSWTPSAPASVAPGASLTLSVFYTPTAADALPTASCLVIANTDPANAAIELSVSGAGSSGFTFEPPIGCSSAGSTGSFVGLAALLALVARRRSRRAQAADLVRNPQAIRWH